MPEINKYRPVSSRYRFMCPSIYNLAASEQKEIQGARWHTVVDRRTPNREVLCSIPTGVTVLYPWARRINSLNTV